MKTELKQTGIEIPALISKPEPIIGLICLWSQILFWSGRILIFSKFNINVFVPRGGGQKLIQMLIFLGSGPDRGRSPVEWGKIPFICPSVPPRGLSQALGGPSQAQGGPSQALEGQIQALGGPSQALEGQSQALEGLSQAQKAPSQALGLAQASVGGGQMDK